MKYTKPDKAELILYRTCTVKYAPAYITSNGQKHLKNILICHGSCLNGKIKYICQTTFIETLLIGAS